MKLQSDRVCVKYEASKKDVNYWKKKLGKKYVALVVRGRVRGRGKSWSLDNYRKLAKYVIKFGYTPVFIGLGADVFLKKSISLLGKTTVDGLIPIFSGAKLVVGQSTGTMHLASLCGAEHLVWGNGRLKGRYEKIWNPFNTKVCFIHKAGWTPSVERIVGETKRVLCE